jgi:dTDP-4-amino-4,6-dideoxygalactose transaminase
LLNTPFSPWPSFTEKEIDVVRRVLQSNKVNYWTGEQGKKFEVEFAAWAGCNHAIALANGTVALDLALNVLGIGAGDEVVVTSRTFLASVSCIVNAGAIPVFADVDTESQNITAETIRAVLSPRTRAVICVHLAGFPCEMDEIMKLAEERNLYVIEDCAQAHGARYKTRSVGTIGHIGAWSFCQDKIMTTGGEGGMVTTNDRTLWSKMWSHKDHGKSFDAVYNRQHPLGFRWLHDSFGTNWRITEMQSAIGRKQLGYMPAWHEARKRNAEKIMVAASLCSALRAPSVPDDFEHAWYKAYVFVRPELLNEGWSRNRIIEEINARGVPCYVGSCSEVYLEKAFDNTGWRPAKRLPVAQELGETSLMFLVHPTLSEAEITKTCDVIQAVMEDASVAK